MHGDLLAGSSQRFDGRLLSTDGSSVIQSFPTSEEDDHIELRTMLAAAGLHDLDSPSDFQFDGNATYREAGVALELSIHYTNLNGVNEYAYRVKRVPTTRVQRLDTHRKTHTTRTLVQSFGISVTIQLSGTVAAWSLASLSKRVCIEALKQMYAKREPGYWKTAFQHKSEYTEQGRGQKRKAAFSSLTATRLQNERAKLPFLADKRIKAVKSH
eukprot:g1336.t1